MDVFNWRGEAVDPVTWCESHDDTLITVEFTKTLIRVPSGRVEMVGWVLSMPRSFLAEFAALPDTTYRVISETECIRKESA